MKASHRLLGLPLAMAAAALAAAPAAHATTFERIRLDAVPYAFEEVQCGIEVQVEGTVSGHVSLRAGKGDKATAFFEHDVIAYRETWTAANGRFVTVTGKSSFNDVKAVPLGDNLFRFTLVEAGQPFRLFDAQGTLLIRDRGGVHFTIVFDTLGDAVPGGIVVEQLEPSVRGPHPGFDDATLCPVLTPLLEGA
jgi:hypothetical protein